MGKLRDGKVGRQTRLAALFADDPNAHVCDLDHGHVVAAVADAGDAFARRVLDEVCDFGFLGGRAAAGDDGGEVHADFDEFFFVVSEEGLLLEAGLWGVYLQGFTVDEKTGVGFVFEEFEVVEGSSFCVDWGLVWGKLDRAVRGLIEICCNLAACLQIKQDMV